MLRLRFKKWAMSVGIRAAGVARIGWLYGCGWLIVIVLLVCVGVGFGLVL